MRATWLQHNYLCVALINLPNSDETRKNTYNIDSSETTSGDRKREWCACVPCGTHNTYAKPAVTHWQRTWQSANACCAQDHHSCCFINAKSVLIKLFENYYNQPLLGIYRELSNELIIHYIWPMSDIKVFSVITCRVCEVIRSHNSARCPVTRTIWHVVYLRKQHSLVREISDRFFPVWNDYK